MPDFNICLVTSVATKTHQYVMLYPGKSEIVEA